MKKMLALFLMLFAITAYSYEWVSLLDDESNTYHLYNSVEDGNIYFSTSEGVKVFSQNDINTYSYGGLDALGVAENENDRFVIFGSGSYSDGLYTLDDSGNIELVDWYFEPKFLDTGTYTNNIYFSSDNNFQINQANEWQIPAEFYAKDVTDITESPTHQLVATNEGFYQKLAGESGLFANRQNFGTVQLSDIDEASGLVASRSNHGVLWIHNDSGGGNLLYPMNELGENLGYYIINGATNRDWEDIAIGNNPATGLSEIYLADTGDNQLSNQIKYIYIVPEPEIWSQQDPDLVTGEITVSHTISFVYPDNENYDSETLLFDQRDAKFYIITKRHTGDTENYDKIFSLDYILTETTQVATYVGEVEIPVDELIYQGATGGDISPDGNFILIKNYQNMYMWERKNMTIPQALAQPYIEVPYIMEPQGEAVAWRYDNNGYFTVSEEYGNTPAILYFYSKKGWRKTSPLPIKKSEYNSHDGVLYGIINDGENQGFYRSYDLGINWYQINNYANYSDIAVDDNGVIFLSHYPTAIPEDWERVTGYYNHTFFDLSSGLENMVVNRLVKNTLFDHSTIFACTNNGVFHLQDYQFVSNEDNDIQASPQISSFPNPFQHQITVTSSKGIITSGKVYNLKGQLVADLSAEIKKGSEELVWKPNHSIPNGIYFIKIQTSDSSLISKVVKID